MQLKKAVLAVDNAMSAMAKSGLAMATSELRKVAVLAFANGLVNPGLHYLLGFANTTKSL